MSKKPFVLITVCLVFLFGDIFFVFGQEIKRDPYLKIQPAEFNKEKFEESLNILKNILPDKLKKEDGSKRIINNSEFWVSYYNSLLFIEGYTLKKEAELEKKMKGNSNGKANKAYEDFLENSYYSD